MDSLAVSKEDIDFLKEATDISASFAETLLNIQTEPKLEIYSSSEINSQNQKILSVSGKKWLVLLLETALHNCFGFNSLVKSYANLYVFKKNA